MENLKKNGRLNRNMETTFFNSLDFVGFVVYMVVEAVRDHVQHSITK